LNATEMSHETSVLITLAVYCYYCYCYWWCS